MKVIRNILFLVFVAHAAEIVVNDTPGEGDYTTIQAAVSAAKDGDTIEIYPNSDSRGYREQVTVDIPNLTIIGKASKSTKRRGRTLRKTNIKNGSSSKKKKQSNRQLKGDDEGDSFPFDALNEEGFPSLYEQPSCSDVFLDGCDNGGECDNTVLTVRAAGVTIENLFLRHGNIQFATGSDGGKFIKNCLIGDDSLAEIRTSGSPNSITVSNNFFQGGADLSVHLTGNFHEISSNLVVPCDDGFYIDGDDGSITNNKMFGCNDEAIEYDGDRGVVIGNEIYNSDDSIDYAGDDGVIAGNTIIGVYNGIVYDGDNGEISENKISSVEDDAIDYIGDNGIIADNEISKVSAEGIAYEGDNPTITHNIIKFIQDDGIYVNCDGMIPTSCTGGTVLYNAIISGGDDDEGIEIINAKNFLVEGNTISYASEIGLLFSGDASTIRGNIIARGGTETVDTEHGMEISGSDNFIEENILNFNSFDGINQARGDNNVYRRNVINGNGRAGIRIEDGTGTVISDNTIINNHGEGIAIESDGTEVLDNEVTNNRIDICSTAANTVAADNTFTTGGFSTGCEPGLS